MIDEIAIRGIGVIEEAVIRPAPGFTAVTGETGAGKTMVVTALELLLGARADGGLVRSGASSARVEVRVRPVPPSAIVAGYATDNDEEMVVERELIPGDDGLRSRVRIGGRLATVAALDEVLGASVEVHTQGAHMRLSRPAVQRDLLDRYAGEGHASTLEAYRTAYSDWRQAIERHDRLRRGAQERAREISRLQHEIKEIDAAELDPEVDVAMETEISRLEHAEQLAASAYEAADALGESGVGGPIGVVVSGLRRVAGLDEGLVDLLDRAEGLAAESADLRRALRSYAEALEHDPSRLERLRQRRRMIADLERRFGTGIDAVVAYADEARDRLETLESEESDVEDLEEQVESLSQRLADLAKNVTTGRVRAAARLEEAVAGHLTDLSMPHARFHVRIDPVAEPGPDGCDAIVFELTANPGEEPRPIADAVSGGERSRLALAVEVALADVDDAAVLVFDEVDAGVGGAAALAVGEKLARLATGADGRQVICVTHLAQIAAFADTHHVVEKRVEAGRTKTSVREVASDDRAAELARMLSGEPDRASGLAHARELLADAAARRVG